VVSLLWIFFAVFSYYIIKPIRGQALQDLIGVDNKPKVLVATAVFTGLFALAYGRIVAGIARNKLVFWTYGIFIGCIVAFALLFQAANTPIGYVFYVWVSTFNVMVVSQFWALQADVWTKDEGKRLFGIIGLGTVSGGVAGSVLTSALKKLPTFQLLFIAAGILAVCVPLAIYILRFSSRRGPEKAAASAPPKKEEAPPKVNAIGMVLGSPYLLLIAAMTLILNIVNSNNEWIMDKMFSLDGDGDSRTFYASFYLAQNILTVAIQLLVTPVIQRFFGARVALLFLPIVGLVGGSAFLLIPTLALIRWMKVAENATDYSIQSNTREFLYLPTTKLEKYAAKNVNDTFVVRSGDVLAAGSIEVAKLLIEAIGRPGIRVMIGANLVLGIAWLIIVLKLGSANRKLMEERHVER
jgi:ATP:ADP antiporter, AAA family